MGKLLPAICLMLLIGLLPLFVVIGVRALMKYKSGAEPPDASPQQNPDVIDAIIAAERERIRAGQACLDKSHWH